MLELTDLSRRYGDVVALDGMTFTVEAGQMFGFVGPNGAGDAAAVGEPRVRRVGDRIDLEGRDVGLEDLDLRRHPAARLRDFGVAEVG